MANSNTLPAVPATVTPAVFPRRSARVLPFRAVKRPTKSQGFQPPTVEELQKRFRLRLALADLVE